VHVNPNPIAAAWRVAALLIIVILAGCAKAPAVKPLPVDHSAEQRDALRTLGFASGDDGWLLNLPEPISFDLEKDRLKSSMQESIANTASGLLKANVRRLRIEGHTDNTGPREHNLTLSQRRAHAVAMEFANNGFARDDITELGLGPDKPLHANDTREGRALNRCVVIIIPVDALVQ
jgi:outer membrane protein OmpA-like peptidoglycan-associated protein